MPSIHRTLFGPFPLDLGEPYPSPFPHPNPTSLPTFPFPGPAASSPLVVPVDWKETRTFPFPFRFPGPAAAASSQLVGPPVDWKETREAHVFMADVPGLRKEEVLVEAEEGNVLKISGGRTAAEKEKEKERAKTWHLAERSTGSFLRRFWLPENVRMDRASATMANGVLTVAIPKERPKKPEINSIEIHG